MMDQLLSGLEAYTAAYLDDLVVFSTSWEEHLQHVTRVLQRLKEAGLTAKPSKCQFAMRQCVYLGHIVGNGLVQPETSKIEAVQRWKVPETKKQVRAFLGLTGYYRRFILKLRFHSHSPYRPYQEVCTTENPLGQALRGCIPAT